MADRSLIADYVTPMTPIRPDVAPQGRLRSPVAAVMFDVYGTLFVSAADDGPHQALTDAQRQQASRLLGAYRIEIPLDALLSGRRDEIRAEHARLKARGVPYPEVVIERIWQRVLPELTTTAAARRFAIQFEFIINPVYPMPGLRAVLSDCRARLQMMGIISNAQFYTPCLFAWMLGADLARLGFDLELVLMSYRFGHAKPSNVLFAEAARRLRLRGISADAALVVGNDMLKDIYPARESGFQTALFAGDERSLRWRREDPRCSDIEPDVIITDLNQIGGLLRADAPTPQDKET